MESLIFYNDSATTEIYTLSLHDALPISREESEQPQRAHAGTGPGADDDMVVDGDAEGARRNDDLAGQADVLLARLRDRKSTRLNSSHANISYAVFCL